MPPFFCRPLVWTGLVFLLACVSLVPCRAEDLGLERLEHFGTREGLSNDWVTYFHQDTAGFLWIGTSDGLNRFDGYRFLAHRHRQGDPSSLSHNFVIALAEDSESMWVGTMQGLNRLDPTSGKIERFSHDPADPSSLAHNFVTGLLVDRRGTLWVGTMAGLHRFDAASGGFERLASNAEQPGLPSGPGVIRLFESRDGAVWITHGGDAIRHDPSSGTFDRFALLDGESGGYLRALTEDADGRLWFGTTAGELLGLDPSTRETRQISLADHGVVFVNHLQAQEDGSLWVGTQDRGLLVYDPESGLRARFWHRPEVAGSLRDNRVMRIFTDRSGVRWLGTESGMSKLDPSRSRFDHLRFVADDPNGLSADWISGVYEDRSGNLWVGSAGEGLNRFDAVTGENTRIRPDSDDPEGLWNGNVMAMAEDSDGLLWLGTHDSIGRMDISSGRFEHPGTGLEISGQVPGGWIYEIATDPGGGLWIGGTEGLFHVDPRRLVSHRIDGDAQGLGGSPVYDLALDPRGDLWAATNGDGLFRLLRPESLSDEQPASLPNPLATLDEWPLQRYLPHIEDPLGLSSPRVSVVHASASGTLWVGSLDGGLSALDLRTLDDGTPPSEARFRHYRRSEGLADDAVVAIEEDDHGNLWIATHRGLSRLDPTTNTFLSFGAEDGLQGDAFLLGASGRRANGKLFFGGTAGLSGFFPEQLTADPVAPPVAITDFRLFNRSLPLGSRATQNEDGELELRLTHRDAVVAFEFAALHFAKPGKNRYAYRLEGFNEDWIETDARDRLAQYTNLDPGHYVFRVRGANADGVWNETGASLALTVVPPPWRTWWAKTFYGLVLLSAAFAYLSWQRARVERERAIAERERIANQQLRQADRLKDEFLANTSHELRTPLYGMTGLAESLIDGAAGEIPDTVRENLSLIVVSGRRLGHLVNDILDFSKLRNESLDLELRPLDLRPLVDVVLALSRPLVGDRDLELVEALPADLPPIDGDENRLQQILHNLVGNAIKFTEAGRVEVTAERREGRVEVRVRDTGIGIPEKDRERIFDAFTQADGSTERRFGGTGLGLAVTRQLVELHGGRLAVESTPGEGSVFFFDLAIADAEAVAEDGELRPVAPTLQGMPLPHSGVDVRTEAPLARLLVVDDEPINRRVLTNQLSAAGYRVDAVAGGAEALDKIDTEGYDLVLLDVMMPGLSGYEVCRRVRESLPLDELPVLFLTAKSQPSDLVVGLAAGANDYLPKPVSKSELLARVKTHLALRAVNRELAELVVERTSQVSEREQLIEEREQLIRQLEAKNADLARFNYTVAHDLQNPLTTITNFLGLARRDAAEGEVSRLEDDFDRLQKAADELRQGLEELFEYSRVGLEANPPETVGLDALVDSVLESLSDDLDQTQARVEVVTPLPMVTGDRLRLEELLLHLVRNALVHAGEGTRPQIEIGEQIEDGRRILWVRDNGLGVDPRYHERIFDLFERLDPTGPPGSGIGLALAKRIAEVHGGRLWVESEGQGHGSTFYWHFA